METRAAEFIAVTGLALIRRVVSAPVCAINYEEHTPEPWNAALLASSTIGRGGPAGSTRTPSSAVMDPRLALRGGTSAARTGGGFASVNVASPHAEVRHFPGATLRWHHGGSPRSSAQPAMRHATTADHLQHYSPQAEVRHFPQANLWATHDQVQHFAPHTEAQPFVPQAEVHPFPTHTEARPSTRVTRTGMPRRAPGSAPPKAATPAMELGEPLLPERADDPFYYPGLVEDPPPNSPWKRKRRILYGVGALALFGSGVFAYTATSFRTSGQTTWSAVIEVTPSEAKVSIDGVSLPGDSNPRTRSGLTHGDHVLTVEQPGYETHRQIFDANEGDRRIAVVLAPLAEPPPDTTATDASNPDDSLSPGELAKKKRSEARMERLKQRYRERKGLDAADSSSATPLASASSASRSAAPDSRAGAGNGLLKLNSIPWSEVYVDDRHVGNTPILGLPIPAGKHTIRLSNPQLGLQKVLRIKLKPGETITKVERYGS